MSKKIINKPKIVLVRPWYHSHLITPPLGLGYLSSCLKRGGCDVKIIDGLNLGYSKEKIVNECHGADLVGINCLSAYFKEVVELSQLLKKQGFSVAIGGPHASALPELTLRETQADYVIIGEGEHSLFELVERIEKNIPPEEIAGVMTKNTKKAIDRPLIEDIDQLPYPDWGQIDPSFYKKAPHGGLVKSFPVAPIISTRGCIFECTFCASPFLSRRKIRFRNPESVVDEIEFLIKNFNVKEIHFEDDNLTLKRSHIENICRLILKRDIKVNWATPNGIRVDTLDSELLALMKKSGCYFIAFGIESGNQRILNSVKKGTDLETIRKTVTLTKKAGIITQGFFIFGLPEETEQTINETIRFAKKIPLDRAQFLILDILPGSELWDRLVKDQQIKWEHASYREATWVPEGLDKEKLNRTTSYAFKSFFFRPKQMFFILRYIRVGQIPFIIRRLLDFNIIPFSKYLQKKF